MEKTKFWFFLGCTSILCCGLRSHNGWWAEHGSTCTMHRTFAGAVFCSAQSLLLPPRHACGQASFFAWVQQSLTACSLSSLVGGGPWLESCIWSKTSPSYHCPVAAFFFVGFVAWIMFLERTHSYTGWERDVRIKCLCFSGQSKFFAEIFFISDD